MESSGCEILQKGKFFKLFFFLSFFLTLDLSKCLVLILAFSILEDGPKSYHSVLPHRI